MVRVFGEENHDNEKIQQTTNVHCTQFQYKSNKLFMSYNDFNLICDMQFCDFARTQSALSGLAGWREKGVGVSDKNDKEEPADSSRAGEKKVLTA